MLFPAFAINIKRILLVALAVGAFALVGSAWATSTKLGDLNGDGVVDVFDLTRLREHIRQTNPLPQNLIPFADLNGDGFLNEDDSVALINVIVGRDSAKVLPLASVRESSPFAGEGGVALTREVILRFTMPLSLNATLTTWDANLQIPGMFYAEAGGRKLLTRCELSGDRLKATLFFLETVPASTRVTVTFDGTNLNDLLERPIDPENDGIAGGIYHFTYDTAPITPVPGTGIIGHVYASEKATGGGDVPLPGVLIRVIGSETLFTFSASDGSFSLNPCPTGRFFVEVDGRTSPLSHFPDGGYYPYINKPWEALPGRADNLAAGGTGKIYLPLVPANTLQPTSATATTTIGFAPSVVAQNPAFAGVEIYVPPNSLFADDGTRGGKVGLAPVASDRLPEPLPPGLHHALDISIQTDGPTNFDKPVPVKFPNLPDPVTGVKLKPGEKSALWSYNHDKGKWEIAGPMTVTDDGNFIVTDVGVGVKQPGWHGANPGSQPTFDDPPKKKDPPDPCKDEPPPVGDGPYKMQLLCLRSHICDQYNSDPAHAPEFPRFVFQYLAANGYQSLYQEYPRDLLPVIPFPFQERLADYYYQGTWHVEHELRPAFEEYANQVFSSPDWQAKLQKWRSEHDAFLNSTIVDCAVDLTAPYIGNELAEMIQDTARGLRESIIQEQLRRHGFTDPRSNIAPKALTIRALTDYPSSTLTVTLAADPLSVKVGDKLVLMVKDKATNQMLSPTDWTVIGNPSYLSVDHNSHQITVLRQPGSGAPEAAALGIFVLGSSKWGYLQVLVRDIDSDGDGLSDSYERIVGLDPKVFNSDTVDTDGDRLPDLTEIRIGLDPKKQDTDGDGVDDYSEAVFGTARNPLLQSGTTLHERLFYLLMTSEGEIVSRGLTDENGITATPVFLAANKLYQLWYYSPLANLIGSCSFTSADAGSRFKVATPLLSTDGGVDSDNDGLSDAAEMVIGTSPLKADSDGDGISDLAEILNGTNPNDGNAAITGILSSIDTPGQAKDIAAQNTVAVLADGSEGLSVFNVANALNPVRTAQVRLTGSTEAVALDGTRAAATGSSLSLLDLSDLSAVRVTKQLFLGGTPRAVAAAGGVAYAGLDNGQVVAVDMATGTEIERLQVANETVHDLSFSGDILYVRSTNRVSAVEFAPGGMSVAGSVGVSSGSSGRPRLFAGGGLAYAPYDQGYTILSLSDPLHPTVLQNVSTAQFGWRHVVPTGSGLGLAIFANVGNGDLHLYDFRPNGTNSQFLTTFTTPGDSQAISIYNGLAYVADGEAGLTVVNYKAYDALGVPPSISLSTGFSIANGALQAEEGKLGRVTAAVTDDVQVRNVEFYVDDQLVVTDGNFPFEHRFTTPLRSPTKTSFTLRAKATDTGGNSTWSEMLTVNLVKDATPPRVIKFLPPNGSFSGSIKDAAAVFSEPINQNTLNVATFAVTGAGPDGVFGTADDFTPTGGAITFREASNTAFISFPQNLTPSLYRLLISPPLADLAGNQLAAPVQTQFRVFSFQDSDGDGIPDDVEPLLGLDPHNPDTDGNGIRDGDEDYDHDHLTNAQEIALGLDPRNPYSNGSNVLDGDADPDHDGLSNYREALAGTDPNKADTDGDGWNDEAEVSGGSNPLDPRSRPVGFVSAVPRLNVARLGDLTSGILANASVIAQPAVFTARQVSATDGTGSASFIATPTVFASRQISANDGTGRASFMATPTVVATRQVSASDGSGSAVVIATPEVNVQIGNP